MWTKLTEFHTIVSVAFHGPPPEAGERTLVGGQCGPFFGCSNNWKWNSNLCSIIIFALYPPLKQCILRWWIDVHATQTRVQGTLHTSIHGSMVTFSRYSQSLWFPYPTRLPLWKRNASSAKTKPTPARRHCHTLLLSIGTFLEVRQVQLLADFNRFVTLGALWCAFTVSILDIEQI